MANFPYLSSLAANFLYNESLNRPQNADPIIWLSPEETVYYNQMIEAYRGTPPTYEIYWTNFGFHKDAVYKTEAEAVVAGIDDYFEFQVTVRWGDMAWQCRSVIGCWSPFSGYRNY